MSISIIIPAYNEADNIGNLIRHLLKNGKDSLQEIIVADGNSDDSTASKAGQAGAIVCRPGQKSRSVQMNEGARHATGNVLYFVHADAWPPASYVTDIAQALKEGYPQGCYRFRFDRYKGMLKVNSFFTRFNTTMVRGGDQTLFITRELFEQLGGYRNDHIIMEDFEFIMRAQKAAPFKIMPKEVIVSARKYEENSWLNVNLANLVVYSMFRLGFSQSRLLNTYKALINHPKL